MCLKLRGKLKKKASNEPTEMTRPRGRGSEIIKGKRANRGMRAAIKRRKKMIILNYLCCLVYDACGIRWARPAQIPSQTFWAHATPTYICKCCKVSVIVSLVSFYSFRFVFPFNSFRCRVLCAMCLRRGKVKHIRHLVLHTIKLYLFIFFTLSLSLSASRSLSRCHLHTLYRLIPISYRE